MSSPQLAALESLLTSRKNAGDPEFKPILGRLHSEIAERLRAGNPITSYDFFLGCLTALSKLKGNTHSEVRLGCAADIGFFFLSHGFSVPALSAVTQFSQLAKQTRNKNWMRRAESFVGVAHMDIGNIAQAIESFSRAWGLAREIGDESGQMSVLVNLGAALNYGSLYNEAIPCLDLVLEFAKTDSAIDDCAKIGVNAKDFECHALSNLAQSYFYLQQFDRAYEAISASISQSTEPIEAHAVMNRVVREFTFVEIAVEVGQLAAARTHLQACEDYAKNRGPRALALAQISRGLYEAYDGNVSLGAEILEHVIHLRELPDATRQPALLAMIRAYERAQRPEMALVYMNELLDHIRLRREKSIETLIQIGPSIAVGAPVMPAAPNDDLQPLLVVEAQLRTKVAEADARNTRLEMLERLAVTADLKEEQSGAHGYRVGKLASLMGHRLNWTSDAKNAVELAARLHDIGKIGVPDRILLKTQQLRDAEREMMSVHTIVGAELLGKSDIPQLRMAEDIARYHHEWWNGSGYPTKLAGKRIPIHARIVALADVFDALTHGRPYAPPWPIEKALEEIQARRGTQFDPELTDRFIELVRRLQHEHKDLDEYLGRAGRNSPFAQARNRIRLMLEEGRERIDKQVAPASETVH